MKNNYLILVVILFICFSSCVSQSKYDELQKKYYTALQEKSLETDKVKDIEALIKELEDKKKNLETEINNISKEKESYVGKLKNTEGELEEKINKINELESLINKQKGSITALKTSLEDALKSYEGKGISIEEKDGNIYVSMENKLLFPSGKWDVQDQGMKALNDIAGVLADNSELKIIVQGHTDTDEFKVQQSIIKDNWDLSVMRATSVVKILNEKGVDPTRLIASGGGQYYPVASNNTSEGKASNRRVDIIIPPNLEKINEILNKL